MVICLECELLDIMLNFIGNYNVFNVFVVIVVVMDEGVDDDVIICVLVSFGGIGCCFEQLGMFIISKGEVCLVDDYGYYLIEVRVIIVVVCVNWFDKCLVMVY